MVVSDWKFNTVIQRKMQNAWIDQSQNFRSVQSFRAKHERLSLGFQ